MSQTPIEQTLQTILYQLHSHQYCMTTSKRQDGALTAMEIAKILSSQEHSLATEDNQDSEQAVQRVHSTFFVTEKKNFEQNLREANAICHIHYYRPIYSCRKWVGNWIVFGKKVARKLLKFLIEPMVEEQNKFNSAMVRTLNDIRNHHVVFQEAIDCLCQETRKQAQALDSLQNESAQKLAKLKEELNKTISFLPGQMKDESQQLLDAQTEDDIYDSIDYFKFQDTMRGSFEEIKRRQQKYLSYFTECSNVIDLGCGRGEFLDVLREHGVGAVGVDNYGKSIDYCRTRGLHVTQGDAIEFLRIQKDGSVDGVFSAQFIEHIQVAKILELCKESHRVMKPDSYIVLETPNPTCLSIYMNSFYLDPSHKNPVHPHLMEYFMQECGFRNIHVLYLNDSMVNYRLPLLSVENCHNLAAFNDGISLLSNIIFGSQDYAIVAQK